MCLRNLFGGNDCTWILFIIIVLLLIDNDDCDRGGSCGGCGAENRAGHFLLLTDGFAMAIM